jgi:nucleotide-binding universal stress UspA family protein
MRNVGVAMDFSANSKNALQWAMENLIRDGDSVVIVIVLPRGSELAPHVRTLWADTGSCKFPPIPPYNF